MARQVLLIGYGSVGFFYTYVLQNSGEAEVTVVARSKYEQAASVHIALKSGRFGDIDGFKPSRVVRTVTEAADRAYAYVIVTTKAIPELQKTPGILAPILSRDYAFPQPTYALLQNGLGVEKDLWSAILARGDPTPAVLVTGAVYLLTTMVDGVLTHHGDRCGAGIGLYPEDDKRNRHVLENFGALLSAGRCDVVIPENIQGLKYQKNIWNAGWSMLASLSHSKPFAFYKNDVLKQTLPFMDELLNEIVAVGRAMGFDDRHFVTSQEVRDFWEGIARDHTTSTLLDIENGRLFELEVILGEVVREARRPAVSAPRLETMYTIMFVVLNEALEARRQNH